MKVVYQAVILNADKRVVAQYYERATDAITVVENALSRPYDKEGSLYHGGLHYKREGRLVGYVKVLNVYDTAEPL